MGEVNGTSQAEKHQDERRGEAEKRRKKRITGEKRRKEQAKEGKKKRAKGGTKRRGGAAEGHKGEKRKERERRTEPRGDRGAASRGVDVQRSRRGDGYGAMAGGSGGASRSTRPSRLYAVAGILTTHRLDKVETSEFRAEGGADAKRTQTRPTLEPGAKSYPQTRRAALPLGKTAPSDPGAQRTAENPRRGAAPGHARGLAQPGTPKSSTRSPDIRTSFRGVAVVPENDTHPGQQFGQGERAWSGSPAPPIRGNHISRDVGPGTRGRERLNRPGVAEPGADLPPVHVRHDPDQDDQVKSTEVPGLRPSLPSTCGEKNIPGMNNPRRRRAR